MNFWFELLLWGTAFLVLAVIGTALINLVQWLRYRRDNEAVGKIHE